MSADKASSENLLNDIVNESTNSVSTQASNFRQVGVSKYTCASCNFHVNSISNLKTHVKKSYIKHSLQCNKCAKLAYSIHELRTHMCWGFPSHDEIANNFDESIEQSISEICEEKDISKVVIDANEVVSDLCLELEGLHKCSQIAIDKVVKAFSDVCDIDLNYIGNKYNRKNYYKDKGIMCTRKEIKLSDSKAYTLSLPNLITVILRNNSIKEYCAKKIDPKCNDGIMRDIIHGNRFLHHPAVKSKLKNNLLLGLYVDDIELVNPLGKNRGIHKICLVYATIFNISVELRSKLSSIFLLGVANANSLKEHENLCLFLEDLIDDFNCLQNGIVVNGERYYIHLYSLHGDALALHQILGFKQSFSPLVKKNCMLCDENKSKYKSLVKHNMCKMRMPKEHSERMGLIEFFFLNDKVQWKEKSQLWGINRKSPLSDIIYFSPVLDSLFDPMHVLLEGLLPNNIQLLLSTLSSQGILNREALNKSIKKFEFCKNIKSSELPKPFTSSDFKVKSTSKSVLTLAIHLPFWLRLIEDNNFLKCFRMLVAIVKIIWSQNVNYYAIQHVSNLIAQYIRTFSEIYPNEPITPKMHMLVHLANQLLSHGPGRVSSCIRFEAKHYVAKRKRFYNFKNLPLSVFDTFMIDMTRSLFHGNGTSVEINSAPSYKTSTIDGDIIMLKKINWMGHTFYIGNFIIIGDADNKPIFGMINLITLSNYNIYFHIKRIICCYDNLSMSYEIISIEHTQELLELGNLPEKYPLISFSHDGKQFIIIPSRFVTPI